jgi:hypothetical protein
LTCSRWRLRGVDQNGWQNGNAVLVAFSPSNNDFVAVEVDVFHAETSAFHQAKTGAVEEACLEVEAEHLAVQE